MIAHGWPGRDRSEFQIPTTANPDTTLAPRSELKEKDVLNGRLSFFNAGVFPKLLWVARFISPDKRFVLLGRIDPVMTNIRRDHRDLVTVLQNPQLL